MRGRHLICKHCDLVVEDYYCPYCGKDDKIKKCGGDCVQCKRDRKADMAPDPFGHH